MFADIDVAAVYDLAIEAEHACDGYCYDLCVLVAFVVLLTGLFPQAKKIVK